jgi:hypothetical protein
MRVQRQTIDKEPDLKRRIKAWLEEIDAWYYMVVPGGYGRRGIPDFICTVRGVFFAIETKTTGKKPTALQRVEIDAMRRQGWTVWVVDSTDTLAEVQTYINNEITGARFNERDHA